MISPRIAREITLLEKSTDKNKTFSYFVNDDMTIDICIYIPNDNNVFRSNMLFFKVSFPKDFPLSPPKVNFVNKNKTRFHPNLYVEGKVCLTILNTWHSSDGNKWSPIINLETIIQSIISIVDENPLSQEPGYYSKDIKSKECQNYAIAAKFASLDNTLNYILDNTLGNIELRENMRIFFDVNIEHYNRTIEELKQYNGQSIKYLHGNVNINIKVLEEKLKQCISSN